MLTAKYIHVFGDPFAPFYLNHFAIDMKPYNAL